MEPTSLEVGSCLRCLFSQQYIQASHKTIKSENFTNFATTNAQINEHRKHIANKSPFGI